MRWRISPVLTVALLVGVGCHRDSPPRQAASDSVGATTSHSPAAETRRQPVVLELFTSQGCSSCPPADRLLSTLGARDGVVALAFHVDYWNYIGWRDPFSSAAATARQRRYGAAIAGGDVYTPMLVIDGREHVVGSIGGDVAAAVDRARARSPSGWDIAISGAAVDGDRLRAEISVTRPGGSRTAIELFAAVRESRLETEVRRGENAGATLANDFIVREVTALDGGAARQRLDARIEPGQAGARSLVVIAQSRATLEVLAAAAVDLYSR